MSKLGFGGADFPVLSARPSLERHVSSSLDEEQRATKKVKNKEDDVCEAPVDLGAVGGDGNEFGDVQMCADQDLHLPGRMEGSLDGGTDDRDQVMQMDSVEDMARVEPDASRSYAAAVVGERAAKVPSKKVLNPDDIVVLDEDVNVDDSGPYTVVRFSDRVHTAIDQSLCQTVVVRLLGRQIGYRMMWNRLQALWKPTGQFQLIDLENDYFLVKFAVEGDYVNVLADGPWTIFGHYLTVQPWTQEFSTSQEFPSHVLVWVRLPGLPYRYYTKALFRRIAAILGQIIKVDYNTVGGERGKFARLAVMVDLTKPLWPCLGIDDFVQHLEYEGLHNICFQCRVYGHSKEVCGRLEEDSDVQTRQATRTFPFSSTVGQEVPPEKLYGPWMIVGDRKRRTRRPSVSSKPVEASSGKTRFDVLAEEVVEE
ncbi:hypothetical protein GQ457_10G025080 [Hibiscus cannabinus]